MKNCEIHPKEPIIGICIAQHTDCQRKLCFKCFHDHKITIQQSLPFDVFLDRLLKLSETYKLNDKGKYDEVRIAFKSLLSTSEEMIKKLFIQLNDSIQYIFGKLKEQDQLYLDLIDRNQQPALSYLPDLDKLVQILEGRVLQDWDIQKNSYLEQLGQAKEWLAEQMKTFNQNFQEEMREIFSIKKQELDQYYQASNQWKQKSNQQNRRRKNKKSQGSYGIEFGLNQFRPNFKLLQLKTTNQSTQKMESPQGCNCYSIFNCNRDTIKDTSRKPEILVNLEQIQHLEWIGDYSKTNQKTGKWIAKWKGKILKEVGGEYSNHGKKNGRWKEMIKNYWSKAEVYEMGEYEDDQRKGTWKYIYEDKDFGGGEYNNQSEKNGKWIELSAGFWEYSQITYNGEYKNGKKINRWEIMFQGNDLLSKQKQIGGGSYDGEGNGSKIGEWIELGEAFRESSQVTLRGEYQQNKKVGNWKIYWCWCGKNQEIGGGQYENGIKVGFWIDLSDGFASYMQVTQNGTYNNGKKVGMWVEKDIKKNEICKEIHYKS
ncbi:unnamed protein product [Paramecium octaurelia]|uniref:MORN repeat protein n=1 Tax=Paramecium octaurelia TaxID=43137 RepID=A0A8S1XZ50_PAROT|nr:unnamed protein product [Paramecium octaurelia]